MAPNGTGKTTIFEAIELALTGQIKRLENSPDAMIRYSCSHLDQNYYLFDYRDEILKSLEGFFGIDLGNKIMTTSEIKKILQYQK